MRPQAGDVIHGKYRIVRLIGDGGMGSVYEARHEYLGTAVALKFLHPELARRPGLVTRFLREAQVAAAIKSPHIAHVHDVDQTPDGSAFLVMELLEGESLQQLLERVGRLPREVALDYALQILAGLEAAHAMGVVHRDLKPDNVFVVSAPGGPLLKVLDFGIAKLRNSREFQVGLTRPGVVMGTPEYMAPEQADSADLVDPRADLYALGAMLYEMLGGRRPAHGDDAHQIAALVRAGAIVSLRDLDPTLPAGLVEVVHRAMAADPAQRFSTAAEMRSALVPFCGTLSSAGRNAATPAPPVAGTPPVASEARPFGSGVARTLPPEAPGTSSATPPGDGPPVGYGSTAAMAPLGYGTPPHGPPPAHGTTAPMAPLGALPVAPPPPPMTGYGAVGTPPPTRARSSGLSMGLLAALAGAAVAIVVIAVVALRRAPDSDGGPPPQTPTAGGATTVAPVQPSVTATAPPIATTAALPAYPTATSRPTTAPPATTAHPTAKPDAGAEADAGIAGLPPFPTSFPIPIPMPSGLPTAIPIPTGFPIQIPGFPVPAPAPTGSSH